MARDVIRYLSALLRAPPRPPLRRAVILPSIEPPESRGNLLGVEALRVAGAATALLAAALLLAAGLLWRERHAPRAAMNAGIEAPAAITYLPVPQGRG